ncbi:hypothetical protein PC9H_003215 [Pleurotus ostreatus]|uniref:BHLH domain-containing protein n=3 Tax=Pleurotus TaxID=5320 RepID=A0A067NW32_PLEO1|nr:uncharacterized protein PC9H_003215 [Pleurotus ostreatus]KAF7436382.1 hypothetical protein PC9H_003215 [Pleurotus ostreatus]KAG9222392.1 hypothetical protein CCMSSC00406_0002727 [Pleurotus cornucopiae]KAJ8702071.1 hypothetical protein PTI98_000818 [Pleurotus ostreatus]KDQ31225.1 hypothetical protein PLEOSDRAFT_1063138 [Pleurotus ostreatus PC15]
MDHQHQQHDEHNQQQNMQQPPYNFYQPEQDAPYGMAYNPQMSAYQVVQPGPQTRQLSVTELQQQGMAYHNMSLIPPHQYPPVYAPSPHGGLALSTSPPPPPSPDMYDPLSPPISGSDTSADGIYNHSNSSGTGSPSSSRGTSLVHRHIRYNPTSSPTSSSGRRRSRSQDSDEEDMGAHFTENLAHSRKEATRRQRIEAEQRRRDELRDGYAKLKDVLPVSNQKSSKVSLLERATNHIVSLENTNKELVARIEALEQEMQRLRSINEKISLTASSPSTFDGRPLSPPPDPPVIKEAPSDHSSPSASEGY